MCELDGVVILDFKPPTDRGNDRPSKRLKSPFSLQPTANGWAVANRKGELVVLCIDYHVARFTANLFNLADLYGARTLRLHGREEE